jgi:hypothetical protein
MADFELTDDFELGDFGNMGDDADFGDTDGFEGVDIVQADDDIAQNRYIPPRIVAMKSDFVKYDNAKKLAAAHKLDFNERVDCIVGGNFIFGDYIEAYLTRYNVLAKDMLITTLSLSQENVDSLNALITHGYIESLDLCVSGYFYSHERNKLIPYIYKMLDIDNRFQLTVCSAHTKICQFTTEGGRKIVMHGSANLRSSLNIEEFTIEENPQLYSFYREVFAPVIERYQTINKTIRVAPMWRIIERKYFDY